MASYHCSVKIMSRSSGRSSVQFSAYMGGQALYDDRLGKTFAHTSKEEVCYNEMIFAERVPERMRDQEKFWNSVELAEKSANAQVSRTWEIALPHELSIEENIRLAYEYARELVDQDGMPACQVAVHQKEGNWHCHIMAPTRDINESGHWISKEKKEYALDSDGNRIPRIDPITGEQKVDSRNRKQWERVTVERNNWNSKELLNEWRIRAATLQNRALERGGYEERVDHRSYEKRRMDIEPTIHEGYVARQMALRGEESERCEYNRAVISRREQLKELSKQIREVTHEFLNAILDKVGEIFGIWEREVSHNNRERAISEGREIKLNSDKDCGREQEPERTEPNSNEQNLAIFFNELEVREKIARKEREDSEARVTAARVEREVRDYARERYKSERSHNYGYER